MKLSSSQIEKVADILEGIGQVLFGSLVLPLILDDYKPRLAIAGLLLALAAWGASLVFLRLEKEYEF